MRKHNRSARRAAEAEGFEGVDDTKRNQDARSAQSEKLATRSKIPFWFADEIPGYVADPAAKPGVRKRVRRKDLAQAFGVCDRTVDYWWRVTKFLPPPHYLETHT